MGAVFDHFPRLLLRVSSPRSPAYLHNRPTLYNAPAFFIYRTVFIYLFIYLFIHSFIYKVRKHRVSGISTYAYYHIASPPPEASSPTIFLYIYIYLYIYIFATRDQPSIEHISAFREKYSRSFIYRLAARAHARVRSNLRVTKPIRSDRVGGEWGSRSLPQTKGKGKARKYIKSNSPIPSPVNL